ncbi:hypothetical protein F5X99DRAFT_378687 [Biscogniauxia marginata]|nr:hypothetical protein F5X99DRAFT_378687 [Biscogniauxia marginata]
MRYPIVSRLVFTCAIGASIAAAIAQDASEDTTMRRGADCSKSAIDSCVATTENDGTACFEQICVGKRSGKTKRQDQCSEYNLLQCAATQDPSDCFQQFCL